MTSYLIIDRLMIDDLIGQLLTIEICNEEYIAWCDTPLECLPEHIRSKIDQRLSDKMVAFLRNAIWDETSPLSPVAKHISVFLKRYGIPPRHVVGVWFRDISIDLVLE